MPLSGLSGFSLKDFSYYLFGVRAALGKFRISSSRLVLGRLNSVIFSSRYTITKIAKTYKSWDLINRFFGSIGSFAT